MGFFNIHFCRKTSKKNEGALWGKIFFRKKSLAVPKKNWKVPVWKVPVFYVTRENRKNLFWSSSLGQMVQFDTIIFGRSFKNSFGQFVWIEKKSHYNSRVSLHEARTKLFRLYMARLLVMAIVGIIFYVEENQLEGVFVDVCIYGQKCLPCGVVTLTELGGKAEIYCLGGMIEGNEIQLTHFTQRLHFCGIDVFGKPPGRKKTNTKCF